ncbi:hypothetical protein DFP72DRAFT_1067544 [Ephemerocybe angulata]|uniref:Uncharacterized protein n=1 Tax=Ephemerocybe angulata TaxID=980116 RepID=A0A8H6I1K6_9AGAR|nr:hypothetical protein DFP72DRAFT_1067544 [Tulosesus angulatus]
MAPQKGKKGSKGKANKDPVIQPPAAQVQVEPPQAPEPLSVVQSMPGTLHFGSAEPRPVSRSLFTNQPSGMPAGTGLSGAFPSALTPLPEEALARGQLTSPVKQEGSVSSNPFLQRKTQPVNSQTHSPRSRSVSRRSSREFMDDWDNTRRSPRSVEQEEQHELENLDDDAVHESEAEHGRSQHEDQAQAQVYTSQQGLASGLRPLGQPLAELNDENSRRLQEVSICIPAAQATDGLLEVHDIGTTMARILRCLTYAREGLHRDFQVPHRSFSRNEYRATFKELLEYIDNALNEVWEYPLGEFEAAYILDAKHMRKLTKELSILLSNNEEGFLLLGKGLPTLPRWGRDGKWDDIWHAIDFEILSVAYRCEVETFLMKIGDAMLEAKKLEREIQSSPGHSRTTKTRTAEATEPVREPSRPFSSVSQRKMRTTENQVEFKEAYPNHDAPPHIRMATQAPTYATKREDPNIDKNPFSKGWIPPNTINTLPPAFNINGGRSQTMTLNPPEPPQPNYATRPQEDVLSEQQTMQKSGTSTSLLTGPPPTFNPFLATAATMPPSYSAIPLQVPRANLNANIFGNTYVQSSSNRLREITGPTFGNLSAPEDPALPLQTQTGGGSGPGGYPDGGDDGGKDPKKPNSRGVGGPDRRPANSNGGTTSTSEIRFDYKLKVDTIPTWDGDADTLGRWLMRVNSIARQSATVFQQLGKILPTRLTGRAENWYFSLSFETRQRMEYDWDTMKSGICQYYMNSSYMERMRTRANKASYRSSGNSTELPSEYFIRKLEMLQLVYNYSERELITEVMVGTPSQWTTILTPHLYNRLEDFQQAIKFHEDVLVSVGSSRYGNYQYADRDYPRNPFSQYKTPKAKVNQVGWTDAIKNPPFPKDDANVSKKGTPVSKGGRPCRHCGSGNHWDYECKYARKGERKARVNMIAQSEEDRSAQEEYDDLYYGLESDEEEESNAEAGFC